MRIVWRGTGLRYAGVRYLLSAVPRWRVHRWEHDGRRHIGFGPVVVVMRPRGDLTGMLHLSVGGVTVKARISGQTYNEISGGSFWQDEHVEIADKFRTRKIGFGWQLEADLTTAEIELLYCELVSQAELLESGGTDDDGAYRRVAAGLRRDAERLPVAA